MDFISIPGPELADGDLDAITGGLPPIWPWICVFFPEYCTPFFL